MNDVLGRQFSTRGVLHGIDKDGNRYAAPYEATSQRAVLDYARELQQKHPHVSWNETSHPGTCKEAGCTFHRKWMDADEMREDGTSPVYNTWPPRRLS